MYNDEVKKGFFKKLVKEEKGDMVGVFIGVAAVIVVGAFVVVPQLRVFAESIFSSMTTWWTSISSKIFPTV